MTLRKLPIILIAGLFILTFIGCGSGEKKEYSNGDSKKYGTLSDSYLEGVAEFKVFNVNKERIPFPQ